MGAIMFGRWNRLWAIAALVVALASAPALANPFIIEDPAPDLQFQSVFALRYWYGLDSTSKDLYGLTRDTLNSRLTYDGMQTHSLEAFVRVDHSSGLFWKGYAGGGLLTQGNLQDEDFPPGITPYSSTNSTLQNQTIGYLSTDLGGALLRGTDFRVDGFVGYHYFHQRMKAFGCQQTASNPDICAGGIPDSVAAIVEDDTWEALRLGLNADVPLIDRWRLDLEGAWLPYVWLSGTDNHLLRPDLPIPIRQDGHGWGYQLEAMLSYRLDDAISLGLGGRYWHMQSQGYAHFEDLGGSPQPLDFKADIYGVFLQGSYRFGPF
jgi:outer membrane protease